MNDSTGTKVYDLIFRHCVQLQSLKVYSVTLTGFLAAAQTNPNAFTRLSHLKIRIRGGMLHLTDSETITAFVASKKRLRCFDYHDDCFADVEEIAPLLSALRSLPALDTLGLDVQSADISSYETFFDWIPQHIKALRLSYVCIIIEEKDFYDVEFHNIGGFPHLEFAYTRALALLDPLKLSQVLKSLQLVGYEQKIWDICRNEAEIKLYPWSEDKILYRTVADLGRADWEWLLSGHNLQAVI